jgi:hypothetical protein
MRLSGLLLIPMTRLVHVPPGIEGVLGQLSLQPMLRDVARPVRALQNREASKM